MSVLRMTQADADRINKRNRGSRVPLVTAAPQPPRGKLKPRYEKMLADQCIAAGILAFVGQYEFHPERNWRIDLAWPAQKLAVEVDGAVHRIKGRFDSDLEKHQALFLDHWRLLRVSNKQVRDGEAVKLVARALAPRETEAVA